MMLCSKIIIAIVVVASRVVAASSNKTTPTHSTSEIIEQAKADGIDLTKYAWTTAALAEIAKVYENKLAVPDFSNATKIDIHCMPHIVPAFYKALVVVEFPNNRVPSWSLADHLAYNAETGIIRAVVSISTPGATIFVEDAEQNAAVARLTNEFMFAMQATYPSRFSFLANMPAPNVEESITEAKYALDTLGAAGIALLSSHQGRYHGDEGFKSFYEYLDGREDKTGLWYHPTIPLKPVNGALIEAYPSYGFVFAPFDFLFDTARNIMNMTAAHTFLENTNLKFGFAHCAGAWASVAARYFSSPQYGPEETWENYKNFFRTRAFFDTAGPMFPRSVQGLFGYGIPKKQLVFGTDFPYSLETQNVTGELLNALIEEADFLSEEEKRGIFEVNAKAFVDIPE